MVIAVTASAVVIHLRLLLSCFYFWCRFCTARQVLPHKPGQHSPYLSGRLCPGICYLSYYWRYWRWFSLNTHRILRNWLQLIFAENWFHLTSFCDYFRATFSLLRKLFYCRSGDASWLNTDGWRYMFCLGMYPCTAVLNAAVYRARKSSLADVTRQARTGGKYPAQIMGNTLATQAVQEIKHSLDHGRKTGGRLLMFGVGVIVIGVMLSIFQQFVGINVVLYYAPEFKTLGASTDIALLQTIIVGVINLTFTVLAIMTVDKFGRKPLQIIGALGMAIGMFNLSTAFTLRHRVLWRYCRCCSMLPPLPCPGVRYAGYCCRKCSRMLFVVKRWQSRWRPWLANYFISLDLPDDGQKLLAGGPFPQRFLHWIYGCMERSGNTYL